MSKYSLWRKCLLLHSSTIRDAVQCLDTSGLRIVLLVDSNLRLIGTVTDGDIRRGLLQGLDLDSAVIDVVNINPLVVSPYVSRQDVMFLMESNKIEHVPVLDENKILLDCHIWQDLQCRQTYDNPVLIMAGGQGTRLRPYTDQCPKPLLRIGDKPLLQHILEKCKTQGFTKFYISTFYLGSMIEDYFGDGSKLDVCITYLREPTPLGTAGSLSLIPKTLGLDLIITNGDVLTDVDFTKILDFHLLNSSFATMAVRSYELQNPFGVVHTHDLAITSIEEKPIYRSHINAGVYVLNPKALLKLPLPPFDMPSLFSHLIDGNERVLAFPVHESWVDIGRPLDLNLAQSRYS